MKSFNQNLQEAYNQVHDFLVAKVGEEVLRKEFDYYGNIQIDSVEAIFHRFLDSLKNRQGYKNFIAPIEDMKVLLQDYNPSTILESYNSDWQYLYTELQKKFGSKYKFDIKNNRNSWVIFTKGIVGGAEFFSTFHTVEDFTQFVNVFLYNEYTIAALPMLLEKELFGFGFPLACDFLKELGFQQYGKPDVHVKDIFIAQNIVKSDTDYEVFKILVKMANRVGEKPVTVDKVYWLIGSGRFEKSDLIVPGLKKEFISKLSNKD